MEILIFNSKFIDFVFLGFIGTTLPGQLDTSFWPLCYFVLKLNQNGSKHSLTSYKTWQMEFFFFRWQMEIKLRILVLVGMDSLQKKIIFLGILKLNLTFKLLYILLKTLLLHFISMTTFHSSLISILNNMLICSIYICSKKLNLDSLKLESQIKGVILILSP